VGHLFAVKAEAHPSEAPWCASLLGQKLTKNQSYNLHIKFTQPSSKLDHFVAKK